MFNLKKAMTSALADHLKTREPIRLPYAGERVWQWFIDLHSTRTWHASGPNPISFTEMGSYFSLYKIQPRMELIEVLRALDDIWMKSESKAAGEGGEVDPGARQISPAMFDAVFG